MISKCLKLNHSPTLSPQHLGSLRILKGPRRAGILQNKWFASAEPRCLPSFPEKHYNHAVSNYTDLFTTHRFTGL